MKKLKAFSRNKEEYKLDPAIDCLVEMFPNIQTMYNSRE